MPIKDLNELAAKVADRADKQIDDTKVIQAVTFDVIFAHCDLANARELLLKGVQHAAERESQKAEARRRAIEEKRNMFK